MYKVLDEGASSIERLLHVQVTKTEWSFKWVSAQDQVFSNCGGKAHVIPASLNSGDAQLRADRAYQIAAAHFYCQNFDEASAEFDAIAKSV